MRRIAVVHDVGAAEVVEIVAALDGLAEPVFVCPRSAHGAHPVDLMVEFGRVCDIGGLTAAEATRAVAAHRPDGITTFSEFQLPLTALLAQGLGLPFHTPDVTDRLTRKHLQRSILNGHGVSAVPVRPVHDAAQAHRALEEIGAPAVLKPDVGAGSRDTYDIRRAEDLERACADVFGRGDAGGAPRPFVLEGRIKGARDTAPWGDYVSVESAVVDGRIAHLAVTGKFPLAEPFRETGSFLPAALPEERLTEVRDLVTRALRALGVRCGICHTEVKLTPCGFQVIEVNGRLGGQINDLLARAAGVDAVRLAARIALRDAGALEEAASVHCRGVAFQHFPAAPPHASRLVAVEGVPELRALPRVSRVTLKKKPGSAVDWRHGRLGTVYVCHGATDTHAELAALLPELNRTVRVRYE